MPITFALTLLESLPDLIRAGKDVLSLIEHGTAKIREMQDEKRDPTTEEWDELNARIKALHDELQS